MAPEDLASLVGEALTELRKPIKNGQDIQQLKNHAADQYQENIPIIQNDMHEIYKKLGFDDDKRDKTYYNKLEQILAEKSKYVELEKEAQQTVSKIKTDTTKLKRELQNEQQQVDDRLKAHYTQIDREKATFSMYHRLCGHLRLDSQHAGPEVRGVVSRAPTTAVTFSLPADQLTAVRLADRLWKVVAEHSEQHPAEHGNQGEHPSEHGPQGELPAEHETPGELPAEHGTQWEHPSEHGPQGERAAEHATQGEHAAAPETGDGDGEAALA